MSDIIDIKTTLKTTASADLQILLKEELKLEDPEKEAQAAINKKLKGGENGDTN